MVNYMIDELNVRGVDGSKVVVRGYYQIENQTVVLIVNEKKKGSQRSPVPIRTLARVTLPAVSADRRAEVRRAVSSIERSLRKGEPAFVRPHAEPEPVAAEVRPPPTSEDLEEVHRIFEESRRRREQRDRRPSKPPGDGSGTPDRTRDSS